MEYKSEIEQAYRTCIYPGFLSIVSEHKEISLRSARLFPIYKPGDEMVLTSIFLSALRLIMEFRREISSVVGLSSVGSLHVFTEITFTKFPDKQMDGLILVVIANKIIDSAILEMKNKNNELDNSKIQDYNEIAKYFNRNLDFKPFWNFFEIAYLSQ